MTPKEKLLDAIEDELYSLFAQIDYGEFSVLEIYWEKLIDALANLVKHLKNEDSVEAATVSELIDKWFPDEDALFTSAVDLETPLDDIGSSDEVSDELKSRIMGNLTDFELEMLKFLKKIRDS